MCGFVTIVAVSLHVCVTLLNMREYIVSLAVTATVYLCLSQFFFLPPELNMASWRSGLKHAWAGIVRRD